MFFTSRIKIEEYLGSNVYQPLDVFSIPAIGDDKALAFVLIMLCPYKW